MMGEHFHVPFNSESEDSKSPHESDDEESHSSTAYDDSLALPDMGGLTTESEDLKSPHEFDDEVRTAYEDFCATNIWGLTNALSETQCFGCSRHLSPMDFDWTFSENAWSRSDNCYECIAEHERNHVFALHGGGKVQCATCDATSITKFDRNSDDQWYERCRACQHPPCCQCGKRS